MNDFFTPPTAEGFRRAQRDPKNEQQAVSGSRQAINALQELLYVIQPSSIIALAQDRHPESNPGEAVALLLGEIDLFAAAVKKYQSQFGAVADAEKARQAPTVSRATSRMFAVMKEIELAQHRKTNSAGEVVQRRKKLEDMKVPQADIERLAPAFDASMAEAEIQVLKVELAALEGFIATRDESLLPGGFVLAELAAQ